MASSINTFKSYAVNVTTSPNTFYTSPVDATTIVLLAQATNVGSIDANVTFYTSIVTVPETIPPTDTEIVKDYTIPVGDAAGLLTGKLVLEPGISMSVVGNANATIKLTVSILETR
jgi:hypothetical protein